MSYNEIEEAVKNLDLIGLETKSEIKKKYLILSKKYHPDMQNGDIEKFQTINKSYKIVMHYIDSFKFRFTKDEFKSQYPLSNTDEQQWSLW